LTDSNEFKDDENDKNWEMPEMPGKPDKFSDAVKIGMRFNISSGVLALIINLVLLAVGLKEECISWNAIENLKKRMGSEARNKHDEVNVGLTCMKMDGKTSKVNIGHNKTVKQETTTVIKEPKPGYLDHFHFAKKGLAIAGGMMNIILRTKSYLTLLAIGCDSTASNTSPKKGSIKFIEEQLGRCVQWIICLFHQSELPSRCLFGILDGPMKFPIGPTGPIGIAIRDINENLTPIVNFQKMKSNVKDIVNSKELFKGQNEMLMFYELIKGIESGIIDKEKYEKKEMPPMSQCRWRTTFMRVLALYIRTENPTKELVTLVKYILEAYGPMCFDIVLYPQVYNGTYHFFNYAQNAKVGS
jgi:hypothetical protein